MSSSKSPTPSTEAAAGLKLTEGVTKHNDKEVEFPCQVFFLNFVTFTYHFFKVYFC